MVKELTFRYCTVSVPGIQHSQKRQIDVEFIYYNSPKTSSEFCNHSETVASIPPMSKDLRKALDHLKTLNTSLLPKLKSLRRSRAKSFKVSKMNGFTAYKSYYTKQFTAVHQAVLSSVISKAWRTDENQDVWDMYAFMFRRYKRSESFFEWLNKTASSNQGSDKPPSNSNGFTDLNSIEKKKDYPIIEFSMKNMIFNNPNYYQLQYQHSPQNVVTSLQSDPNKNVHEFSQPNVVTEEALEELFLVDADLSTLMDTSKMLESLDANQVVPTGNTD